MSGLGIHCPVTVAAELAATFADVTTRHFRESGREVPPDAQRFIADLFAARALVARMNAEPVFVDEQPDVRTVDSLRSSPAPSTAMTYTTAEAVERSGKSVRTLQARAHRGTLRAARDDRGDWLFDAESIDQLAGDGR